MKRSQLMVDLGSNAETALSEAEWEAIEGLVCSQTPAQGLASASLDFCLTEPGDGSLPRERQTWVRDGLVTTQASMETDPEGPWVCRVQVSRQKPRYSLNRSFHGSGFIYYSPDPTSLRGYWVAEEDQDLNSWLRRLRGSAIERLWLHNPEAASVGQGLDLELLERVREAFAGELWISGGAREIRHLENLAHEGGADRVVLSVEELQGMDARGIRAALTPRMRVALAADAEERVCGHCG